MSVERHPTTDRVCSVSVHSPQPACCAVRSGAPWNMYAEFTAFTRDIDIAHATSACSCWPWGVSPHIWY